MQRLSSAARDRTSTETSTRRGEDSSHILRLMTNLLAFPSVDRPLRPLPGAGQSDDTMYQLLSMRRSTVSIRDASAILGLDRRLAEGMVFDSLNGLPGVCRHNAEVARQLGQLHRCRIFSMLEALLKSNDSTKTKTKRLAAKVLKRL
jgi:hypothetical protein